MFPVLLI